MISVDGDNDNDIRKEVNDETDHLWSLNQSHNDAEVRSNTRPCLQLRLGLTAEALKRN